MVVKTDDDMFLDLFQISNLAKPYQESSMFKSGSYLQCPLFRNIKIIRNPESKWFVTNVEMKSLGLLDETAWPGFCSGWLYISNPQTLKRLLDASMKESFFWIDDVWVTGILAKKAKINHIDISRYLLYKSCYTL